MKGQPYQAQIKQFKRAYMYGIPENCSVDWFLMILLNVGMGDTKRPKAKMFPAKVVREFRTLEKVFGVK